MKMELDKLIASLFFLGGALALANADLYPFMPFGLFTCFAVFPLGTWFWRGRPPRPTMEKPPSGGKSVTTFLSLLACVALLNIGLTVEADVSVASRPVVNICVVALVFLSIGPSKPKHAANKNLDPTNQGAP